MIKKLRFVNHKIYALKSEKYDTGYPYKTFQVVVISSVVAEITVMENVHTDARAKTNIRTAVHMVELLVTS